MRLFELHNSSNCSHLSNKRRSLLIIFSILPTLHTKIPSSTFINLSKNTPLLVYSIRLLDLFYPSRFYFFFLKNFYLPRLFHPLSLLIYNNCIPFSFIPSSSFIRLVRVFLHHVRYVKFLSKNCEALFHSNYSAISI